MLLREFKAACWPATLKVVSFFGSILVCCVAVGAYRVIPPVKGFTHHFGTAVACIPPLLILGSLLFVVRSYAISGGHLGIRRLFWTTTIPIRGIHEAYPDPLAIKGSLRIWGNGGLFGITGIYWNKRLGRFRLFATDPAKAVVLKLHDRIVVITPEEPQVFLQGLQSTFPRLKDKPEPPAAEGPVLPDLGQI